MSVLSLPIPKFIDVRIICNDPIVKLRFQNLKFLAVFGRYVFEFKLVFSFQKIILVALQILVKSKSLLQFIFSWGWINAESLRGFRDSFLGPFIGGIRIINLFFDGELRSLHLRSGRIFIKKFTILNL